MFLRLISDDVVRVHSLSLLKNIQQQEHATMYLTIFTSGPTFFLLQMASSINTDACVLVHVCSCFHYKEHREMERY